LKGSTLADPSKLRALLDDPAKLRKTKDPMLGLARSLAADVETLAALTDADRGRMLVLEPEYFALLAKLRGQPLYSDANSTLRFSHASVQGYAKWDGQQQTPQTDLAGAVAKHTDSGEFDLPDAVLAKAEAAKSSRWADAELGDVPVAFLADGDTTGGNSGSPVIDGKGRLVGFNFDRVWENVSGDYAWRPDQSRNIISDARYLYWMLEEVAGAEHLLTELGVADWQPPPPSSSGAGAKEVEPVEPGKRGCGCVVADGEGPERGAGLLGLLGLLGLYGLRRR
jgi:MYXO-CTERM domain-containing protein